MAKGVFLFRSDSIYEDRPEERYHFPSQYLSRASQFVGDWVLYFEPVKAGSNGYHAAAKVRRIIPDPSAEGMFFALIEPGSYLPFEHNVRFRMDGEVVEQRILNDEGKISGRAQSAVRPILVGDFDRILLSGFQTTTIFYFGPERRPASPRSCCLRKTERRFLETLQEIAPFC